jgi:hypothetical protein
MYNDFLSLYTLTTANQTLIFLFFFFAKGEFSFVWEVTAGSYMFVCWTFRPLSVCHP